MVLFRVEQLAKDEEEERRIKSLGASISAPEHVEARQTTFQVSLYMLTGTILGTFELGMETTVGDLKALLVEKERGSPRGRPRAAPSLASL